MSLAMLEIHPCRGRRLVLRDHAVIGRGRDCELRLDDPMASRRHARIRAGETGTAIEDLGSRNGLYVNGRPRRGITALHPGDVVQLGATLWQVLGE